MGPIEILVAEHRVIEKVLTTLSSMGAAASRGECIDRGRLIDIVTFLRRYADAYHHGKEEKLLFPTIARGPATEHLWPPMAALKRDHEIGRLLVGDLASCAGRGDWSERDRATFRRAAHDFVSLLRRHILDEDRTVFPAMAVVIAPEVMARLETAFAAFERDHAEERGNLLALAERLAAAPEAAR